MISDYEAMTSALTFEGLTLVSSIASPPSSMSEFSTTISASCIEVLVDDGFVLFHFVDTSDDHNIESISTVLILSGVAEYSLTVASVNLSNSVFCRFRINFRI